MKGCTDAWGHFFSFLAVFENSPKITVPFRSEPKLCREVGHSASFPSLKGSRSRSTCNEIDIDYVRENNRNRMSSDTLKII